MQVVQYAEKHGKRPAGHKVGVNEQCISKWCKKKERLESAPKSKQAFRCKKSSFSQIEDEVCAYDMDLKSGYAVSIGMLQLEVSKVA
jgi:hypothetical protein